jgi:signal transduction histidine kinase
VRDREGEGQVLPEALLVHGDPAVAAVCGPLLGAAGFAVREAAGAVEALALARSERPVLVVIDRSASAHGGTDVLERLRADESTAHVTVVMVDGPLSVEPVRELTDRNRADAHSRGLGEPAPDVTAAERAQAHAYEVEREAVARLREVDRLRSDFLSTVSHELRTPLTAIRGFAEYLVDGWDTIPDQQRRDMVYRILHAGARLDFLIQDLLDFSKLERGHLPVELVPHRLSALVEETLRHVDAALEGHQLDLRLDDEAWVMADRSALVRVVENLLTNAAKFSPKGSTISVRSERRGDHVILSVRDEGVGMPEQEHERVFDRFYRVPETAALQPGTGIGLAIVKQFAEAQGAEVLLRSTPGEGSEFLLLLVPAVPPA